jgi:Argonaute linker 1 domain
VVRARWDTLALGSPWAHPGSLCPGHPASWARGVHVRLQVWLGYSQSLRATDSGLSLNVNTAAAAFLEEQPVVNLMAAAAGLRDASDIERSGLTPDRQRKMSKAVTGVKVQCCARSILFVGKQARILLMVIE